MSSRPYLADDRDALSAMAEEILAERQAARIKLVEKFGEGAADERIRAIAAIAADWRRVVDLYAGRPAAPENETASPAEKIATLEIAFDRTRQLLERARQAVATILPADWMAYIAQGAVTREHLAENFPQADWLEVHLFLMAERRHWAVEALLWHARHPRSAMFFAELNAEMRERGRAAEAA